MSSTLTVPIQLFTVGLVAMLGRPVSSGGTGRKIHEHKWTGEEPSFPYVVVRQVAGGETSGPPLTAPDADAVINFQIDSVGSKLPAQAQFTADRVREVMLGRNASGAFVSNFGTIPGWSVCDRVLVSALGGVETHGTAPNETFVVPELYALHVTPA